MCDKCKGQNHFASVCHSKPDQYWKSRYTKSKKVHPVEQSSNYDYEAANRYEPNDDRDDESIFCDVVSIGNINKQDKWQQVVLIENSPVQCKLDTGAQANILPLNTFRTIRNDINLDPSVPPVIQPARKVPYTRYDQLKATLEELEKKNIIATDKPTDWVSNLVITEKKNGQIRICLDPKPLNKAIKWERCNIPG